MQDNSLFRNISPLDHRYYEANRELFDHLRSYISEEAALHYHARVEGALLKTHLHFRKNFGENRGKGFGEDFGQGFGNERRLIHKIDEAVQALSPAEVYRAEERTQHHVQALVHVFRNKVPAEIRQLVHVGATSMDIVDTAGALRMKEVTYHVLLPQLLALEEELITLSGEHAETPQIGRTHGQYAVPITLGYAFAEYVSRLGASILEIARRADDLRGKMSGAVGSYNAMRILYKNPVEVEKYCLSLLSLKPSDYSTQIVEPEYQLRLLLELNTAFGIIANLADDLRHLQRSEIHEAAEHFASSQVGSSTMPHKRNPWNCEHVKSMWKVFAPRVVTMYMDQISEHQRDMTNSASARFIPEYICGFSEAVERMKNILKTLAVDTEGLQKNLRNAGSLILAEPAYILLARQHEPHAHERIRKITLAAEKEGIPFHAALMREKDVWKKLVHGLETSGLDADFFQKPSQYRGLSADRARELCRTWRSTLEKLRERSGITARSGGARSRTESPVVVDSRSACGS